MDNLKRIDPSTVPGVFSRVGATPVRRSFVGPVGGDGKWPCCLLTALYVEGGGGDFEAVVGIVWNASNIHDAAGQLGEPVGLSSRYALGLVDGWEGWAKYRPTLDPTAYRRGLEDGRAAWEVCEAAAELVEGRESG
jgi:hypothetical protein